MELTYTLDQLKVYVNNENVKEYFFSNFGLSPEEVLSQIESTLSKRTYFNEYYQKRWGPSPLPSHSPSAYIKFFRTEGTLRYHRFPQLFLSKSSIITR